MHAHNRVDRTGQRYGRLLVIGYSHTDRHAYWRCVCDCGTEVVIRSTSLARMPSCGCLARELSSARAISKPPALKHGHARNGKDTATYYSFCGAKSRCTNPDNAAYPYYGGRGIECRFESVVDLIADIGEKPGPGLSLDRIDNDGHYERGNVRWATAKEQANNRRARGTALAFTMRHPAGL